jgi:hypothetical protein
MWVDAISMPTMKYIAIVEGAHEGCPYAMGYIVEIKDYIDVRQGRCLCPIDF